MILGGESCGLMNPKVLQLEEKEGSLQVREPSGELKGWKDHDGWMQEELIHFIKQIRFRMMTKLCRKNAHLGRVGFLRN